MPSTWVSSHLLSRRSAELQLNVFQRGKRCGVRSKRLSSWSHSAHSCGTSRLHHHFLSPSFLIPMAGWPGSWRLTSFGGSFCCEVGSKLLEDLCAVFLHEEADEVGGGVELQGQWG